MTYTELEKAVVKIAGARLCSVKVDREHKRGKLLKVEWVASVYDGTMSWSGYGANAEDCLNDLRIEMGILRADTGLPPVNDPVDV